MIPQAKEIEALATKFSKPQLQQMAQLGQIDPQTAVMAGMMIDRIMQSNMQPPQTTVAQDVMGMAPPQESMGMAALPAAGMAPPQMAAPAGAGLDSLPVPDTMFDESSFAGGGIVAFAPGGMAGTFDAFTPSGAEYDEFSSYQPLFPGLGSGNRRYQLKQLGYTNEEIAKMTPAQQEFVVQRVNAPDAAASAATALPPVTPPSAAPAASPVAKPPVSTAPVDVAPTATAAPITAESQLARIEALRKAAGLPDDPEAEDRKANAAAREALAKDREQAKYMAILQAGLGMMGGTSPRALENIAKGIAPAVGDYTKATRDIKADEREISKIDRDLRKAADARKRGNIDKALELEDSAFNREMKLRTAKTQENVANAQIGYFNRRGTGDTGNRDTRDALKVVNDMLLTMGSKDPRRPALEQQRDALLRSLMGGAADAGAGTTTVDFSKLPK